MQGIATSSATTSGLSVVAIPCRYYLEYIHNKHLPGCRSVSHVKQDGQFPPCKTSTGPKVCLFAGATHFCVQVVIPALGLVIPALGRDSP